MRSASAAGASIAPPMPCRARNAISEASDQARPQSSELAANTREAGHEETPSPEQVAEPAAEQERPAEEDGIGRDDPLQARLREAEVGLDRGSATFTMATSRITMNCAVTISASALQRSLFRRAVIEVLRLRWLTFIVSLNRCLKQ